MYHPWVALNIKNEYKHICLISLIIKAFIIYQCYYLVIFRMAYLAFTETITKKTKTSITKVIMNGIIF